MSDLNEPIPLRLKRIDGEVWMPVTDVNRVLEVSEKVSGKIEASFESGQPGRLLASKAIHNVRQEILGYVAKAKFREPEPCPQVIVVPYRRRRFFF